MMSDVLEGCPLPKEVAEALQPYIKTRQEVEHVRRGLQASFPVSTLDTARKSYSETPEPGGLTGVRKAYLQALQAHRVAQERYDALKTELEQLSRSEPTPGGAQGNTTAFLTESYVPLIRQRERRRKLAIVEKTLAKITAAGGDTVVESFDKVAKREVGELPHPPSTSGYADRELESDYDLTRLKKAILSTKRELEEHEELSAQANGIAEGDINPHADLKALQKTHSELTAWMENQLAMISDVDSTKDGSSSTYSAAENSAGEEAAFSLSDIENLYKQYLDSRQRLLRVVSHQERQDSSPSSSPDTARRRSTSPTTPTTTTTTLDSDPSLPAPSELILPYLSRLTSAKQTSQSLSQQTTHLRRQLILAETQTQDILTRLADESHLVQPEHHHHRRRGGGSAPQGQDWREAAEEAREATVNIVKKRVESGNAFAEQAVQTLESIHGLPGCVDGISLAGGK